jgi:RNA polymerase sigma-70 factor (ECF subfamily)
MKATGTDRRRPCVRRPATPTRASDAAIVARCRRGDDAAWPELVRSFAPYVHAVTVRAYGLSEQDAEDVFQEVFLRTWKHLGQLRSDDAVRPWIGQLTRRLSIDRLRARARELSREDVGLPAAVAAAEDALAQIDEALSVRQAISRLPRIQQEIIERAFVRGESHATIAAALGIAEGTVASRICRARERLRRQLSVHEA